MKILLSGGLGFLGRFVYRKLKKAGHEIGIVDNKSTGNYEIEASFDGCYGGDIRDFEIYMGFDCIIHLAAKCYVGESMENPKLYHSVNIMGTHNILNKMIENKIPRIVFASSCTAQGKLSPYATTKAVGERMIQEYAEAYGISYAIVRPFNLAGAGDGMGEEHDPEPHLIPRLIKAALNGDEVLINGREYPTKDGTNIRDYVHVQDVADLFVMLAGERENGIYEAGTGIGYSNLEILKMVEDRAGKIGYEFTDYRDGDAGKLVADPSQFYPEWKPKRSIEEIIESAIEYHRRKK
jgi:UDP-glucose 4-epimerase